MKMCNLIKNPKSIKNGNKKGVISAFPQVEVTKKLPALVSQQQLN